MSEINWENIYYNLSEFDKYEWSDIDYAYGCAENLKNYVPALIERIQKLAKEKSELKKENESLKLQLELKNINYGSLGAAIDWTRISTRNAPGMHSILPFQTYEPKFTPVGKNPRPNLNDNTVWSDSTMRDSL